MSTLASLRLGVTSALFMVPSLVGAQEVLVSFGSDWNYFIGSTAPSVPPTAWRGSGFSDSSWVQNASTAIGYSSTPKPISASLPPPGPSNNNYVTVYFRKTFTVQNQPTIDAMEALRLELDFDDGFVAYINGEEAARFNAGAVGQELDFDDPATGSHEFDEPPRLFDVTAGIDDLVPGDNLLAVEVHNANSSSTDLIFNAKLAAFDDALQALCPMGITCVRSPGGVSVSWSNHPSSDYDSISVTRDGVAIAGSPFLGDTEAVFDSTPGNVYSVVASTGGFDCPPLVCIPTGAVLVIATGDDWTYFKGTEEPSPDGGGAPTLNWTEAGFDDSSWLNGLSGFGYGSGDAATVLDDMKNGYSTVYLRKTFAIPDPSEIGDLHLRVDFDDGFVAYVNGEEIARSGSLGGIPGTVHAFDETAAFEREAGDPDLFVFDGSILVSGLNTIALQGFNASIDSPSFTLVPELVTLPRFSYSINAPDATGPVGHVLAHKATVELRAAGNRSVAGVQGWAIGVATDGESIENCTTDQTAGALVGPPGSFRTADGFERTELASVGNLNGCVSSVVLSFAEPVTLPPLDFVLILRIALAIPVECERTHVRLACADGLVGSGLAVHNLVTFGGNSVRPALGDAEILVDPLQSCEAHIVLSDILGGGNGTGTAPAENIGISPDTGQFEVELYEGSVVNTTDNPQVADSDFIDSVFIIDATSMEINTDGVLFTFEAGDATGGTWNHIVKDASHDIGNGVSKIYAGSINTWETGIGIHAASGITFNLAEMRLEHGAERVKYFTAFAGSDQCPGAEINLYAILSDAASILDSTRVGPIVANQGDDISMAIPDGATYLTLAVGAANSLIACDHGVFAEATVSATSALSPLRSLAATVLPCPPSGDANVRVTISQETIDATDPEEIVIVTEEVTGSIGPSDVTAGGAIVTEKVPNAFTEQGFIRSWLLLGPFLQTGGAVPGEAAIGLDYLTDGAGITEAEVEPVDGDTVSTDFLGAAASTGLAVANGINPGGVPTWSAWIDADDTVDFSDYYGAGIDNVMMYAVTYLHVANDTVAELGIASDDSVQVLLDDVQVYVHSVARAVGSSTRVQDVAPVILTAGFHTLMVKVFDGIGPHAFRLRFQDTATGRAITQGINVCLEPQAPCPFAPDGVRITWHATREELADGLEYDVNLGAGTLHVRGDAAGRSILGEERFESPQAPPDFGPFTDPDLPHAHMIGAPCPGTSVTSPSPGDIVIAGAGETIWATGDQFMYAYGEVTGDFSARVTIRDRDFAPGSRWGKHGIMARQDCAAKSRYSFIHDNGEDLQDVTRFATRPIHNSPSDFEVTGPLPAGTHYDTLRLDRCGNEFIGYVRDDFGQVDPGSPGAWVEVGRHDWGPDAPEGVQLGLAVTSHLWCNITTITFTDWEVTESCTGVEPRFVRGDVNSDGVVDLSDGIAILNWKFLGGPEPACLEAANVDDDGGINITDPIRIFNWLFVGGPAPEQPAPSTGTYPPTECGPDPTPPHLGCARSADKCQ